MSESMKKKLTGIAAVVLIIVAVVWMMFDGVEPIEDINGPDDYSLAVITDEQILQRANNSTGVSWTKSALSSTVKIHSGNFSGVEEIKAENVIFSTGLPLDVINLEVNSGNFRMVVVNEDRIVMDITPETEFPLNLGSLNGLVRLVIAGESADFSFEMWEDDVELH